MICLASDHAGFELKKEIKKFLEEQGLEVEDMGPYEYDKTDDYPDFIIPAAEKVAESPGNKGIVFGHSGQGEAIAANKVKGIRAVLYNGGPLEIIKLTREHNDSNVLSMGQHFVKPDQAREVVKLWLDTPFKGVERHVRRLKKISDYEAKPL